MPDSPSVAHELVAHSGALRRLARDLVGQGDADDLVQDTAVRALRSPPPVPHGLFSWLSTVMHNLASNRRRGEQRRRRHEAVAGGQSGPPADADAVHRDSVRAVTEALWALPEPYQSTLVQRYFEELSPSRIAARSRVPLATVKSRLQRGLELLRTALERREGRAWRAAIGPAFGLGIRSSWLLPVLSVSSMSTLAKSGFVLAACAVAALTWWAGAAAVVPPASAAVANANQSVASPITAGRDQDPGAERAVVAPETPDVLELAQPHEFELRARVVDADGLPFAGGHVAIAPPGCALALSEQMDGEGVTVRWRARAKELTMAVGFAFQGETTSLQQIAVAAGVPADVRFVAGAAPLPAQVTVDALGRQIVTMPDCSQDTKAECRTCHERIDSPKLFDVRGAMRAGLHPDAVFGDRLAVAPPDPDAIISLDDVTWSHHGIAPSVAGGRNTDPTIRGRVFRADGQPAARVLVQFLRSGASASTHTRADGYYSMTAPGEGPVMVRAGGGPEGLAARVIEIAGAQTIAPDLFLDTGRTLRGRVRGSNGAGLNGARVEYVAAPGSDGDVATVGPDGAFAFANLPPGPGRLLVWGVAGEKLPVAEEASVLPNGGDVEIDLRQRAAVNGALRVFVRDHAGENPQHLEVRCWQQQTKRGAFLDRREDGAFHAHGLMAGFYRVEVGTLATGFRDVGVHWVDGNGVVDLGTVQLPQPGRLKIDAAANLDGLELYAARQDLDVRADEVASWTRDVLLPPGRWLALWKRDGKVAVREFALEAGAVTTLQTDR